MLQREFEEYNFMIAVMLESAIKRVFDVRIFKFGISSQKSNYPGIKFFLTLWHWVMVTKFGSRKELITVYNTIKYAFKSVVEIFQIL